MIMMVRRTYRKKAFFQLGRFDQLRMTDPEIHLTAGEWLVERHIELAAVFHC